MKNSISRKGSILWNVLTPYYHDVNSKHAHLEKVENSRTLINVDFNIKSPETIRHIGDEFYVF